MIAQLAHNVAKSINASSILPNTVKANRHYLPNIQDKNLEQLQVLVIATKPEILEQGRDLTQRSDAIRIAFLQKLSGENISSDIDNLIDLVESLMRYLSTVSITVDDSTFMPDSITIPNNQTMYSFEDLRTSNEFVSVIEVNYTSWVKK